MSGWFAYDDPEPMTTPIRRQYLDIKRRFPKTIVFFRLGDFYETFDEDAKLVARELEITLTSKTMGKNLRVPLAGVPHHSLQTHLRRLVGHGFKVAICEQLQDPKQTKGLVDRDVVRVVTPGTVVEEELLGTAASNYLAAIAPGKTNQGLAYIDITTGEFAAAETSAADLKTELARLNPSEILAPEGTEFAESSDTPLSGVDPRLFRYDDADERLREHFQVASMEGFGLRNAPLATAAADAVLAYLADTQKAALANVKDLSIYNPSRFLVLDGNARRHLEVFTSSREGGQKGSLLAAIDSTQTPMGSRLLARWLGQPLLDPEAINSRLDRVEELFSDGIRRAATREKLKEMPDIERIVGRISTGLVAPRDLAGLRRGLETYPSLIETMHENSDSRDDPLIAAASESLALLNTSIADEPAPQIGDGGVIRDGFSQNLDEARVLTSDVRRALTEMEAEERDRTGIRSLRVAYNRVFGYYIEVTNSNLALVPDDFQRRQTLVGAERFTTVKLKELEDSILAAREEIGELEASLFRQVCAQLAAASNGLQSIARTVAEIDVFSGLAETAARQDYRRPIVDAESGMTIGSGRHPVVETALGQGRFVPNDSELDSDDAQIVILTGPNMAGKSTYLRQVALITLLAQTGSFVPAVSARIGVVDRIFTRIGAQDDVSRGESTFMVEMLETAAILRNASRRSLVLFDEVGRGTSTYDGLAIARAVVEYLHAVPRHAAKTLFATHYHEMTQLAAVLPRVRNFSVAVSEQEGEVVFLHRIVAGGADRSYGIHVAELAGMPAAVIENARQVLASLEDASKANHTDFTSEPAPQLSLIPPPSPILAALAALEPDSLTPLQALEKLYELKANFGDGRQD